MHLKIEWSINRVFCLLVLFRMQAHANASQPYTEAQNAIPLPAFATASQQKKQTQQTGQTFFGHPTNNEYAAQAAIELNYYKTQDFLTTIAQKAVGQEMSKIEVMKTELRMTIQRMDDFRDTLNDIKNDIRSIKDETKKVLDENDRIQKYVKQTIAVSVSNAVNKLTSEIKPKLEGIDGMRKGIDANKNDIQQG